jgi:hypothetical protein
MGKSSTGKDSFYKKLMSDETLGLKKIVMYTTRPIRAQEKNGEEYFFVNDEKRFEPDSVLSSQAEKYVSDSCSLKYKKSFFCVETLKILLKMAISGGIGVAVGTLLF